MNFVEHLFLDRHQVDTTAAVGHLGQHRAAVTFDLENRKGQVPWAGDVLVTRIGEIAAGDLGAALDKVSEAVSLAESHVVQRIPAEFVHHWRHENRGVGHTPGHDNVRALFQCVNDGLGPQVNLCRYQ